MSDTEREGANYPWHDASFTCAHDYILPLLHNLIRTHVGKNGEMRILDLGCGNGAVTAWLADRGFDPVGVDPSPEGIAQARAAYPHIEFRQASAYDPLHNELGRFPLVVSLEVIEHVYDPLRVARTAFDVLSPEGTLVMSTPYHGWLKNVAIALLGRFDDHVDPLRLHGHIKFWSQQTLTRLLEDAGFEVHEFRFAGRIRPVAKSMIVVAQRPSAEAVADNGTRG